MPLVDGMMLFYAVHYQRCLDSSVEEATSTVAVTLQNETNMQNMIKDKRMLVPRL